MKHTDIIPGHTYEAKHPKGAYGVGEWRGMAPLIDDRTVLWINRTRTRVLWFGPKCYSQGGREQVVDMKIFLKWAARDITAIIPKGEWREWVETSKQEPEIAT